MALSLLSATPFLLLFYQKIAHVYEILGNLWIRRTDYMDKWMKGSVIARE
jgi:hypothetical protein